MEASHGKFQDRDCFLRMDRFARLPKGCLDPMGIKLTRKAREYVLNWYEWFTGVRGLEEELGTMRDLLIEELNEQIAKQPKK